MIVYLEIPPLTGRFPSLAALLPPGEAGWLGEGDVSGCRLVGTDLPLAEAARLLPDAGLWTFILYEPMSALAIRWASAQKDPADPAHVMANTFNVPEAAQLGLPEAALGALTRHLSADGRHADPAAVIAHLETLPMLIGFVQNPFAYRQALDELLALAPPRSVDAVALGGRVLALAKPVQGPLTERLADDLALAAALIAVRGERRIHRTAPARALAAAG